MKKKQKPKLKMPNKFAFKFVLHIFEKIRKWQLWIENFAAPQQQQEKNKHTIARFVIPSPTRVPAIFLIAFVNSCCTNHAMWFEFSLLQKPKRKKKHFLRFAFQLNCIGGSCACFTWKQFVILLWVFLCVWFGYFWYLANVPCIWLQWAFGMQSCQCLKYDKKLLFKLITQISNETNGNFDRIDITSSFSVDSFKADFKLLESGK